MRRLIVLAAIAMIIAALPLTAASAKEKQDNVYLALGDSVAAGTQNPDPFTDDGYVDALFKRVRGPLGLTDFVNLACPGDDTGEMLDGDDPTNTPIGSICYGDFTAPGIDFGAPSQVEAAEAFLAANAGNVGLITITVGANDILGCQNDPICIQNALAFSIPTNLSEILFRLQAAAPGVPIVGMNYYNPNLAYYLVPGLEGIAEQSNQLTALGNQVLTGVYTAFGVPVADVANTFRIYEDTSESLPLNVRLNCLYTAMCDRVQGQLTLAEQPDIHPSDLGYRRIAAEFKATIKAAGLL